MNARLLAKYKASRRVEVAAGKEVLCGWVVAAE
jgi:hypothetical protein